MVLSHRCAVEAELVVLVEHLLPLSPPEVSLLSGLVRVLLAMGGGGGGGGVTPR